MDRRKFLTAAGSTAALALAGCLDTNAAPAGEHDVGMTIDSFRPETLTVDAGTTVEFRNTSGHTHTVTAIESGIPEEADYFASGGFDSREAARDAWDDRRGGKLEQGDSFEHTFEIPGSYPYICIPHLRADMRGTIEVTEPGEGTDEN